MSILVKLVQAFVLLLLATTVVIAQTAVAPSTPTMVIPDTVYTEVWAIFGPILTVFISTVAPVAFTWMAARIISLLKIKDANAQSELESRLRDALHASALSALKFALTKNGAGIASILSSTVINDAMDYVKSKNPDTAKAVGLDDDGLKEIIISKAPDVINLLKDPPAVPVVSPDKSLSSNVDDYLGK